MSASCGNIQPRKVQFASTMDISCAEYRFKQCQEASFPKYVRETPQNSRALSIQCQGHFADVVQKQVENLFPEFFQSCSKARLAQTTDLTDFHKYCSDPMVFFLAKNVRCPVWIKIAQLLTLNITVIQDNKFVQGADYTSVFALVDVVVEYSRIIWSLIFA